MVGDFRRSVTKHKYVHIDMQAESRMPRLHTENNRGLVELRNQMEGIAARMGSIQVRPRRLFNLNVVKIEKRC